MKLEALAQEYASLLSRVAGDWSVQEPEAVGQGKRSRPDALVGVELEGRSGRAWVCSADGSMRSALTCEAQTAFSENDVKLLKKIAAVYRTDLTVAGGPPGAEEAWRALGPTRFLRAAARFSSMTTDPLLRRVRIFEAAAQQTYEGSPFVGGVVMAQHLGTFRDRAKTRYRGLNSGRLEFHQAMLREKWLRPFLESGSFALVTAGLQNTVYGITDASTPWETEDHRAPVPELRGLYGYLSPGTSLLSASPAGDVLFSLPNDVDFVKSKGQWRYQNWSKLANLLQRHCSDAAATSLLRAIRSASYHRRGSLYVVVAKRADVQQLIPDHLDGDRVSKALRATMSGVKLTTPMGSSLIEESARIDGAIVLDGIGRVLDVASMVGEPSSEVLRGAQMSGLRRFSGARTTAAWNASCFGLAIKISDDGPVDVYEKGAHVFGTQ